MTFSRSLEGDSDVDDVEYDRARVSTHEYLGETRDVRTRAALRHGEIINVPFVEQEGCCLLPGQTLALLLRRTGHTDEVHHRYEVSCRGNDNGASQE
jgi:hypothetical protein